MGPVNRPLELAWLEDFQVLAGTGNFSRAAEARSIAQPALSRHIRALEEWVGVELVDRSAHPVSLTAAGQAFAPRADELLAQLDSARTLARSAHEQANQTLQLAATHVLSMTFFPAWLSRLEQHLEIGAIQMVSDSFQACEDLMLQRKVQFLLCHGHPATSTRLLAPQFGSARVGDDQLLPVAAPLTNGRPAHAIDGPSGKPVAVLSYSQESGLGQIMRSTLPRAFDVQRFTPVFTSHHAVLLRTMTLEGRGAAWLPRSLIEQDLKLGSLVEAGGPPWQVPIEIRLVRPNAPLSAAAEELWKVVSGAA